MIVPSAWSIAWGRATLVPAARRATPVWIGAAIAGGVLFGPNGMDPRDLTEAIRAAPAIGVVLAAAWLLLIGPVGRVLVRAPGTDYLRSLPAPRGARWAIAAAGAVAVQAPWALLWGKGEGVAAGAAAAAVAAVITLVAGVVPAPVLRPRAPRWRRRWWAAAAVHARGIARTAGASLVRGAGLALLGGAVAGAIVRVNALAGAAAVTYAGAVVAVLVAIGLAGAIAAVADAELRIDGLARATGIGDARAGGVAFVLAMIGAALGAIAGAAAAGLGGADAVTSIALLAAAIGLGVGLGLAGARLATHARRTGLVDGATVVVGVTGLALAGPVALGAFGPAGIAAVLAFGAALAAANADAVRRLARVEA